jgi:hypothetical protein
MKNGISFNHHSRVAHGEPARSVTYPAMSDCVDLPDLTFHKNRDADVFTLVTVAEQLLLIEKKPAISDRVKGLDNLRLMKLFTPLWSEYADADITLKVMARRGAILTLVQHGSHVVVEAHWNLFIPYFFQIKELPLIHSDILDLFADAVFDYVALAIKQHSGASKNKLEDLVVDDYLNRPELLLASMDIFNKHNIYHIHPKRMWINRISIANDVHRVEIDASAAAAESLARPEFLEEVTAFVHNVVKGYAFRYVDYLGTQRYRIFFSAEPDVSIVGRVGAEIAINICPLIDQAEWKPSLCYRKPSFCEWKPALYLSLGYAIILAILEASGADVKKSKYLSMMKAWNHYLSLDDSAEQRSVEKLFGLSQITKKDMRRSFLEYMTGQEGRELVDDFITLMDYSAAQTFSERLKVLNDSSHPDRTGVYYERLWDTIRDLNTTLIRNNITHGKLIETLRNDYFGHVQLADLLLTGRIGNRSVVDVSEWLLLRTLIYDLINAPRVFRNDYKMLLKILTKVNKGLIIYIWALILSNDTRCELVNGYISGLITDIFVFDRVKIYEIVADPVECLEAEAVTGYLLNWADLSLEKWRSIIGGALSRLPSTVVRHLSVQSPSDVDQLIRAMTVRASGLIGFCLHKAYRWGSTTDDVTERIRSYFPELLKEAQKAVLPQKTIMGGTMLLVVLAQIISDERDGFASNIAISDGDRAIVRDLIRQCVDWDQKHFVMMVAGIAAGYMGRIDGRIMQQFDTLLGRYGGGDRVVLRSVVVFDVEILVERALITAKAGRENELLNNIQLLRTDVDPVISNQANKSLKEIATRYGIQSPELILKRIDIREFILDLSQRMKA